MNQNKSVKIRFKGFTEAWEQRKLEDCAAIIMGQSPKSENYTNDPKDHVLVQGNADLKNGQVVPRVWTTEVTKVGKVGDIILSVRAPVGEVGKTAFDVVLGRGVAAIRGNDFLLQTLQKFKECKYWGRVSAGSTFDSITSEILKSTVISMPTIEEQIKIGDFLSSVDNLITLHQRKLNRFQKIRTTFLQKMFPKNGETKPAIRLTGFNADWEQEKLQNFAVRITRKNIKKQNNRPLTISAQHGLVDQTVYFNNRVAAQDVSNYYLIKKGEFAYNRSTSKDAPVGAVRRLVDYEEGVLSTLYLVFSITDPQHVDPNYLSYFFETTGWHSWILERAAEGARNHGLLNVSSQDFLSLPVMLPSSLEEQQKIGEFFQKIDDCIILLERQADLLKQIKSSLLLSMFPPSNAE